MGSLLEQVLPGRLRIQCRDKRGYNKKVRAPVAQRIERWPPEPGAWVRFPPGARNPLRKNTRAVKQPSDRDGSFLQIGTPRTGCSVAGRQYDLCYTCRADDLARNRSKPSTAPSPTPNIFTTVKCGDRTRFQKLRQGERQTSTLQTGKGYWPNLGHQEDETGLVYMLPILRTHDSTIHQRGSCKG